MSEKSLEESHYEEQVFDKCCLDCGHMRMEDEYLYSNLDCTFHDMYVEDSGICDEFIKQGE